MSKSRKKTKILCDYLYTSDREGHFYENAVLFLSEGKIDWAGSFDKAPKELLEGDYIEWTGKAQIAMPGLINGHGHSNLNGYRAISDAANFNQWAADLAPYTSTLTKEDIIKNNQMSVLDMIRGGTTCICDCTRYEAGRLADTCAELGMRCLAGGLANSPELRNNGRPNYEDIVQGAENYKKKYQDDNRMQFYLGAHSTYSCTGDMLKKAYEKSKKIGSRFIMHAAETVTEEKTILERTGMRPIPWLDSLGVLSERTILIHCVQLNDEDIEIIRKRGSSVIHCPISNAKLGNGISPVKKMRDRGIPVGLGTDSMLSNNGLDMFREMKMAALLSRLSGKALSNEEIVKMATSEGARILGFENTGSLEPGKSADILLLQAWHPLGYNKERFLSDVIYYMDRTAVDTVFVNGDPVYTDNKIVQADETLLRKKIEEHYRRKIK